MDLPFAILILDFKPLYNIIILTFKGAEWCYLAESEGFFCPFLVCYFSLNSFSSEAGEKRTRRKGEKEKV